MKQLFPEERTLTRELSREWQAEVVRQIECLLETFKQKGDGRDETSCVWQRLPFPDGMLTIIEQKLERMQPLLATFNPHCRSSLEAVQWDKVIEESLDIATYLIFFAAIARMLNRRGIWKIRHEKGESHG